MIWEAVADDMSHGGSVAAGIAELILIPGVPPLF